MKRVHLFTVAIVCASLLLAIIAVPFAVIHASAETPADAFAEEVDQLPDAEEPASPAPSDEPTEGVTEGQPTTEPEVPTTEPEPPTEEQPSEDEPPTEEPEEPTEDEPVTDEPSDAVQQFIDGLKEQYGNNWTTYYNAILAQWGTVENYLMSLLPEDSPDVVKDAWLALVAWTRDNWVILAAIGATIASAVGVIVYVFAKKRAKAFMLSAYDDKFAKLYEEYNKQSAAIKAQNAALIALTGANPKYEETRAALQKTGDELDEPSGGTK